MKKIIAILLLIIISPIYMNAYTDVIINVLDRTGGETVLSFQDWTIVRTIGFVEINNIGNKEVKSDSTFTFIIETFGEPNIVVANLFRERENKQILITPGDTIMAVIDFKGNHKDRFEVVFWGNNEHNYNAYNALNQEFDRNVIMKAAAVVESLEKYLQMIDSAYLSNTNRINEVLPQGILRDLMLNEEKVWIFKYLEHWRRISSEELSASELLSIKKRYFPDGKISCDNPLFMKSSVYNLGMLTLSRLLLRNIKAENQLMAETDIIKKHFAGELRDFLLVKNFGRAVNRNRIDRTQNDSEISSWYYIYSEKITNRTLNKYIQFSYERYKILDNPFPENVLNSKIIQLADSTIYTISDFLKKYKGEQLIIGHWATWCAPCLREIMAGKESVQRLREVGNRFIYVSLDEVHDFSRTRAKAIELGIVNYSYLIIGGFNSEYAKYLNISNIPRHIMIDVNGNIRNLRLPLPSSIIDFSRFRK